MATKKLDISRIANKVMQAMTFTREDYKNQLYADTAGALSEWMKREIAIKNSVLKGNWKGWTREVSTKLWKLDLLLGTELRHGNKEKAAFEFLEEFFRKDAARIANKSYKIISKYSKEKKEKFKGIKWDNEDLQKFRELLTDTFKKAFS